MIDGGNNVAQKFKTYQGQEISEELGYNMLEFKYRHYDPSLGRFFAVDPLAMDYVYNSPYAFQENKLGLGTELEGKELKRFKQGVKDFIQGVDRLISGPTNRQQMDMRGYSGDEQAEVAYEESRAETANAAGQAATGFTESVKGGSKIVGDVLEAGGDGITVAGIATAQPQIIAVGEAVGATGSIINAAVDLSDGKSMIPVGVEMGIGMAFGKATKEAVTASQTAAGSEFVQSGANKVTESILQGAGKVFEEITKDIVAPVFGPVENPNN